MKMFWWLVNHQCNMTCGKWTTARKAMKHMKGDYENGTPVKALSGYEAIKQQEKQQ